MWKLEIFCALRQWGVDAPAFTGFDHEMRALRHHCFCLFLCQHTTAIPYHHTTTLRENNRFTSHTQPSHQKRGNTITAFVIFLLLIDFKSIVTICVSKYHHQNKTLLFQWVITEIHVTILISKCHHCCSLHQCIFLDCLLLGEFPFVHREYSRKLNFKLGSFEIFQSSWSPTSFSSQYSSSLQGYFFPPSLCRSNPGRRVHN